MSDVIAGAAIAGGVGLAGTIVAYLTSRYASSQETARRRDDLRNSERALLRDKYSEIAWCLGRLHKYGSSGTPPTELDWRDWLDQWAYWRGVGLIVGSGGVAAAVQSFTEVLDEAGPSLMAGAREGPETWVSVYRRFEAGFERAAERVLQEMRLRSADEDVRDSSG